MARVEKRPMDVQSADDQIDSGGLIGLVTASCLHVALLAAMIATCGSLFFSEVLHWLPCQLCWYQRILMYPLVIVLGVAALRKDRRAWMTVLPFVAIGAGVSTYHWLVERVPSFAESSSCSLEAPCTAPWFEKLGFVTLAWMALSGFLLIGTLMVCQIVGNRVDPGDSPPEPTEDEDEEETVTS
jgi:disulfide bond formation protein DsbB